MTFDLNEQNDAFRKSRLIARRETTLNFEDLFKYLRRWFEYDDKDNLYRMQSLAIEISQDFRWDEATISQAIKEERIARSIYVCYFASFRTNFVSISNAFEDLEERQISIYMYEAI